LLLFFRSPQPLAARRNPLANFEIDRFTSPRSSNSRYNPAKTHNVEY
jgi:hypothetical protein